MNINELVMKYKDLYELKETIKESETSGNEYTITRLSFIPNNLAKVLKDAYPLYTRFCQNDKQSEVLKQYYEVQQKHLSVEISFLKFLETQGELKKEQIREFKDTIFKLHEQKHDTYQESKESQSFQYQKKEKQKINWFKRKRKVKKSSFANDPNSAQYILNKYNRLEEFRKEFDDITKKLDEDLKKLK